MDTYEKKYKEALSHAREIHRNEDEKRRDMEWLFPELKESEDEKIRKALINVFATHKDYEVFFGVSVEDIRTWLEKQGEQKASYTTIAETGNGGINALVTRELPTNGCGDEQNPADKAEPIVVRDFNSVFSREKVKEIDKRIEKSQKLYNAKLRDAMRKVEDFPMTD